MSLREMFVMHAKRPLKELYLSVGLFAFAFSLIAIFEPIFLYEQGIPVWGIALYYMLHYGLYVLLLPLGGKFASRFGLEQSIVASLPVFVLYFIALASIPQQPLLVLATLSLLAIHKILYWPAYYAIFCRFSDAKNRGTELSWLGVFQYGAGIGGPAIGAFIAVTWGFPTLFLCAGVLVLLAGIPLISMKHAHRISPFPYRSPWNMMVRPEYRKVFIATLGFGESLIDQLFWPLFLFLMLGSLQSIGIYLSLSLAAMMLITFSMGERAEKGSKEKLLRSYVPFMVVGYFFRMIVIYPLQVLLTDSLARISFSGVFIPLMYTVYSQARTTRSLEFLVAFEMVLAITKCAAALGIAFLFMALPLHAAFTATFGLAILFSLFYTRL